MKLLCSPLFLIVLAAECLMMSRVLVPQYKLVGSDAMLKCEYDLGRDHLYAVKWYKDNEEFFRYVPRFNPPIYTHLVEGVRVESSKSNDKHVLIRSLTVKSTGVYRCEVSAEAPSFASIMGEGRMTVIYLPKEPPQITGVNFHAEYEVGDVLDLNCTSDKSFPPANLMWFINDNPVKVPWSISLNPAPSESPLTTPTIEPSFYRHRGFTTTSAKHSFFLYNSHLMISSLRLQIMLENRHFGVKGTARVRCVATISPLFWQDGDERIFGHQDWHSKKKVDEHKKTQVTLSDADMAYEDKNPPSSNVEIMEEDRSRLEQHISHHNYHYRHENTQLQYDIRDDDKDGNYYYEYGKLPSFQREALVLVKAAGCSTLISFNTWLAYVLGIPIILVHISGAAYAKIILHFTW